MNGLKTPLAWLTRLVLESQRQELLTWRHTLKNNTNPESHYRVHVAIP